MIADGPLFLDGCDDAVVGWAVRCGQPAIVVYDHAKLVEKFMDDGMTEEEAHEWVSFNIEGVWVGKGTPAVMYRGDADEAREALGE